MQKKSEYFFRILEISPNQKDFVLKQSDFDKDEVKLYQYTIREYNAIREDMIGKYDMVYIGNGTSNSEEYYTTGQAAKKIPAGNKPSPSYIKEVNNSLGLPSWDKTKVKEFYPGNDFTELILGYLKNFHEAGQLVVADSVLATFASANARVHKFVKDNSWVIKSNRASVKTLLNSYADYDTYNTHANPRPYLEIISKPAEFDGTDESYIDTSFGTTINYEFKAMGYEADATFDVALYFDINGDNKFKTSDDELIKTRTGISSHDDLVMSVVIPEDFKGLQPYKFEITDRVTGAVNYETGYLGFRGNEPIYVNVLQIYCNGNTFDLSTDLVDNKKDNLLTAFSEDYIIDVDTIHIKNFIDLYDDSNFKLVDYVGEDNSKPYNMIIFGFADVYGNADIIDEAIADDIKEFINTGQSVMFTHDNLTFRMDSASGWTRKMTDYFRDFVGQNIYADGNYPDPNYISLGFSDMAYERGEGKGFKVSNNVYAFNDGIMTNYPFPLINDTEKELYDATYGNRLLNVAKTHYQYYQLDLNDEDLVVWYTLADANSRIDHLDPQSFYYTYSVGNVTYSGTGHSDLDKANTWDERKLFVNTMIKAVRGGANFAPEVVIQGVTDGDNVANLTQSLTFSIIAKDPDINDQYMSGKVYLDMDGDGLYESNEIVAEYDENDHTDGLGAALENGVARSVSIDLSKLVDGLSEFSFKVVASDTKGGAQGFKESTHPLVSSPVIEMEIVSPGGILLGDDLTITNNAYLTVPNDSFETKIENIVHTSGLYEEVDADKNLINSYNILSTSNYIVSNYIGDYGVSGDLLRDSLPDISNPTKGLIEENIGSWSYDFKAKVEADYVIGGGTLDYELEFYGDSIQKSVDKTLLVKRGNITYNFEDDFGAPISGDIPATLYHYSNLADDEDLNNPNISNGTIIDNVTIEDGKLIVGDDADEILETGYYVLVTDNVEGLASMKTEAVYIDYTKPHKAVEIEITAQPISGFKWVHSNAVDITGILKALEGTESSDSLIMFSTYKVMNELSFSYDDSNATEYMTMAYQGVTFIPEGGTEADEVDVTAKFTHDSGANTITWTDAGTMPTGDYAFEFSHNFYVGALAGSNAWYYLDTDIVVEIDDVDGNPVDKTYSFPDVSTKPLDFLKSLDIL